VKVSDLSEHSRRPKECKMSDPKAVTIWSKIEGIDDLSELALNLHWSWNHASDQIWEQLDAELWEATQNPWVILQTVSKDKIKAALAEPEFRYRLNDLLRQNRNSYQKDAWFQKQHQSSSLTLTAYFSMEFMLSESLPIYSGGLGNVAGDQMKAASDLGVPIVGVGLLYGKGYFRQEFDSQGQQRALYPVNDPGQLPIRPLCRPNGEWLRLEIILPGGRYGSDAGKFLSAGQSSTFSTAMISLTRPRSAASPVNSMAAMRRCA
jgi:starch phosphorylase